MYLKISILLMTMNVNVFMISSKGTGIIPDANTDNF